MQYRGLLYTYARGRKNAAKTPGVSGSWGGDGDFDPSSDLGLGNQIWFFGF